MQEPVLPAGIPQPLDQELLAWAAGFFDGEGSTIAKTMAERPNYCQLQVAVPQSGHDGVPEVLTRFRSAALGTGRIEPPNKDDIYAWRARGRIDAEMILALMWPYLGDVKRAQACDALARVAAQYEHVKRRPPRYVPTFVAHPENGVAADPERLERAWAAGFLDAEGWFGVVRGNKHKDGSQGLRIRVSAPQHSADGAVPAVLLRLQRLLGGVIEVHGEADDYKWVITGRPKVVRAFETVSPWLGSVKRAQAASALARYDAHPRLRGTGETCVRGHTYDAVVVRPSGKTVKICLACQRMRDRAKRIERGGRSRTVKTPHEDPTRVYRVK